MQVLKIIGFGGDSKKAIKESKVHAQWVANYLINKLGISETRIQIVFGIKGDGSLVTLEGVFE